MIKRDITETILEYDNEGKLVRKTVTETHEEEEDKVTVSSYQTYPSLTDNYQSIFGGAIPCRDKVSIDRNDSITHTNDLTCVTTSHN